MAKQTELREPANRNPETGKVSPSKEQAKSHEKELKGEEPTVDKKVDREK